MTNMKKMAGLVLATTAAAAFALAPVSSAFANHADQGVKCAGVNGCKGKDTCKGRKDCKGKGWVKMKSEKDCIAKGGTVITDDKAQNNPSTTTPTAGTGTSATTQQ